MKQLKQYKIIIENRNYSSWHFVEPCTNIKINIEIECPELVNLNPVDYKLFSRDIFTYSDLNNTNGKLNIEIVNHYLKPSFIIAGVLQLENNKTFGRTANKKRLLYKCIPDDKHLPSFLIPYDIKMSFSKVLKNKYVVFVQLFFVGILIGLVGAGGGFLIIPALIQLAKLPIKKAIGTSLFIISVNSLIGFLGDVQNNIIDWPFLLTFTAISVIGIFVGFYIQQFINEKYLKKIFGIFVLVMSMMIFYKEFFHKLF